MFFEILLSGKTQKGIKIPPEALLYEASYIIFKVSPQIDKFIRRQ